jgi:hypothetical protein
MVILAAATVIVVSAFVALVAWRLYRMGRELQHDVEPVVESMRVTADTVRDTTSFVGSGAVSPAVSVIGLGGGARHMARLVNQARLNAKRKKKQAEATDGPGSA